MTSKIALVLLKSNNPLIRQFLSINMYQLVQITQVDTKKVNTFSFYCTLTALKTDDFHTTHWQGWIWRGPSYYLDYRPFL